MWSELVTAVGNSSIYDIIYTETPWIWYAQMNIFSCKQRMIMFCKCGYQIILIS